MKNLNREMKLQNSHLPVGRLNRSKIAAIGREGEINEKE
jgi:hypothetical protein